MIQAVEVLSVLLVAVAFAMSLAHALELPGKLRLAKHEYLRVQPIYYPGFSVAGGIGEGGGLVALLILLALTPVDARDFWLLLAAWITLAAMHAVYWLVTHPVNQFWLRGTRVARTGRGFFGFDPVRRRRVIGHPRLNWAALRDRWEYSHVLRAVMALTSLVLLVVAVTGARPG